MQAWSRHQLTMRGENICVLAADLCTPYRISVANQSSGRRQRRSAARMHAAIRTPSGMWVSGGSGRIEQLIHDSSAERAVGRSAALRRCPSTSSPTHALDEDFAGLVAEQFNQRWNG